MESGDATEPDTNYNGTDSSALPRRLLMSNRTARPQSPVSALGWHMFDFVRTLGRGSSGTAELVKRKSDDCLLVMKAIHVDLDESVDTSACYTEVKILSKLTHPHIVGYHGSFIHNNWLHILMDYADGGTLEDRVREHKKASTIFSKEEVMAYTCQLILAMKYIHSKRILHRDLKLANVFLDGRTYVKLGDFGLARALSSERELAETACGTPYYLSPELCLGHPYDQKSDCWAMGCVMYELLTLRRPFQGQNLHSVVMRICHEECPPIPGHAGKEVINLTYKLLSKAPGSRPSMTEAQQEKFISDFMETTLPGVLKNSSKAAAAKQFRPKHRRVASDVPALRNSGSSGPAQPAEEKPHESPEAHAPMTPVSAATRALEGQASRPPRAPQTPLGALGALGSASPKSTPSPAASPVPHRIRSMFDRLHHQLATPDGSPRSSPGTPVGSAGTPVGGSPGTPVGGGTPVSAPGGPQQLTPPRSSKPRAPSPVQALTPVPAVSEIDKPKPVTSMPGVSEAPQQLVSSPIPLAAGDRGSHPGTPRSRPGTPSSSRGSRPGTPSSISSSPVTELGTVELPNVDPALIPKFPPIVAGASTAVDKEKLQLEAIAAYARSDLLKEDMIKDRGNLLRTFEQCFLGSDLLTWMVNFFGTEDRNAVRHICDLLLVRQVVHHVARSEERVFADSSEEFYRFQDDMPGDVMNLKRVWDGAQRHPSEVVKTIVRHLYQLYKSFVSANGKSVDYDGMKGSPVYTNFALAVCELQVVSLNALSYRERLAFYINLYNALCLQCIFERGPPGGQIERWRQHNNFSYSMNGLNYSIADLKHGIIRGNQKQPISIMRQFGDDDPRKESVLGILEPRVHFALCEGSTSCGRLRLYTGGKVDKELQDVTASYLVEHVKIDTENKTVSLPEVLKTYSSDFAASESEADVLKWVAQYLPPESSNVLSDAGKFSISYTTMGWELNALAASRSPMH